MEIDEKCLHGLGMGSYEIRAYLTLVFQGCSTAMDIAASSRVPRQRIYDVLATMAESGLVVRFSGSPTCYQARDPAFGISQLVNRKKEELNDLERQSQILATCLREAWNQSLQQNSYQHVTSGLPSKKATLVTENQWRGSVRCNLSAIAQLQSEDLDTPWWIKRVSHLTQAGGLVRCIYPEAVLKNRSMMNHVRRYKDAGEEARVTSDVPTRMLIADRDSTIISIASAENGQGTKRFLLIEQKPIVRELLLSFDLLWERSTPISL